MEKLQPVFNSGEAAEALPDKIMGSPRSRRARLAPRRFCF